MKRLHQLKAGGPKAYWAAMRALTGSAGGFTCAEVAERFAERSRNTVKCYVRACVRGGHVEQTGERPSDRGTPSKVYAVKVTAPEAAPFEKPDRTPRFGAVHRQIWTAMRALPRFTSRELAAYASTDDVPVSPDAARIFCWKLERAGYLQDLGKTSRWRVLRLRPGKGGSPTPPAILSSGEVIDRGPRGRRRAS